MSKRSGERCRVSPMHGAARCYHHLGTNPRDLQARVALERQARRLAQVGDADPINVDEVTAHHLALAGHAEQWMLILQGLVAEFTDVGYESRAGEQTRAAARLYTESIRDLNKILTDIGRLGLEERQTAVVEAQEIRLRAVLVIALQKLGGHSLADAAVAVAVQEAIAETAARPLVGRR